MAERDFKGVWIDKDIWLDDNLSPFDKVLLVEIDSLDGENGCYKSNAKFAEFMQCSDKSVSRSVKKLEDFGYIKIKTVITTKGTKRTINLSRGGWTKCLGVGGQSVYQGNTVEGIQKEIDIKDETCLEVSLNEKVDKVISYLNEKTGKKFRAAASKTKSLIQARINEGYNLQDFKNVVDTKIEDWLNTDSAKYIRPETLFGNKFDGYLNEMSAKPEKTAEQKMFESTGGTYNAYADPGHPLYKGNK